MNWEKLINGDIYHISKILFSLHRFKILLKYNQANILAFLTHNYQHSIKSECNLRCVIIIEFSKHILSIFCRNHTTYKVKKA